MPRKVMIPALANWRPHQSRLVGTERVYRMVATRWRK
jgi:hypothetical protein